MRKVFSGNLLNSQQKMEPFWEPNGCPPHAVKYESDTAVSGFSYCSENGLNFSASGAVYSEDDTDFTPGRRGSKVSRQDPLSHRIIEKRRRDRMNSCLADLSRLIPPQYQRKGRGRIEKTEIIEMSIRYMKQLQNQEYIQKESAYKLGYEECMQQAANFLYNGHRDICFQLVNHLKEHSSDVMKGEYIKMRHNIDSRSASSGSPPIHNFHPAAPLNQLRDMLSTSDLEHSNSPDHNNDVKDLSLRSQPHQAAVITSTAPPIHLDTTNSHDFDSFRPSPNHLENGHPSEGVLRNGARKLSDAFHDSDHSGHYSYKFKNYFKERFSQDNHIDEAANDSGNKSSSEPSSSKKPKICVEYMDNNSCDEKPSTNGITEFKPEVNVGSFPLYPKPTIANGGQSRTVPIFALHALGRYYVPLNVDYDALVPYLTGLDLLEKNSTLMPPLHAININVHFPSPKIKTSPISQTRVKADSVSNGW